MTPTTSLVPPRRLGSLLRDARMNAGRELADLTAASGLSVVELDDIEHGRRTLDEATLTALVSSYGVEDVAVVPERSQLVIDLDEGRIAVDRTDVDVDPAHGPDAVLTRYLALVYRLRSMPLGTPLQLRDVDVDVLSTSLTLQAGDVEGRLHRLMNTRSDVETDQRRIRRQLLLPLVGVIIAATGVGTLVLVAGDGEAPTKPAAESIATDIGNGGAVETDSQP